MKTRNPILFLRLAIVGGLIAVALSSCGDSSPLKSESVSEDRIFRSYSLTYTDGDRATNVFARFFETSPTGSSVALSGSSSISVQDSSLRLAGVEPRKYSDGAGGYGWVVGDSRTDANYTFNWMTPSQKTVADRMTLPIPVEPKLSGSVASYSNGARIQFNRLIHEKNVNVKVTLNGMLQGSDTRISVVGSVNSGDHIDFPARDLQKFSRGQMTIQIETQEERDLPAISDGAALGKAAASYLSREYDLPLTQ